MFEMKVNRPYKLFKMNEGPSEHSQLSKNEAVQLIRDMMMIRRIESTANVMYKEKLIRGFLHLCNGQEAIYAGTLSELDQRDSVITAYRCHGFAYMMGISAKEILAELTGAAAGSSKGKGGSMHIYNVDRNFLGGNGIVGAQVPVGAGVAFAYKYKQIPAVSFTFYGDGAANQGQVFEAFNMAKLHMLPCVFICENNNYAMGTAANRGAANTAYYTRGDYIPGVWVDGMDVVAVREAIKFARNWCVSGNGPLLMEFSTYRYMGHSMSDPGISYRSRDEIERYRKNEDPINTFKDRLISTGIFDASNFEEIETDVKRCVIEAENFARQAPKPNEKELSTDVYTERSHNLHIITPDRKLCFDYSL